MGHGRQIFFAKKEPCQFPFYRKPDMAPSNVPYFFFIIPIITDINNIDSSIIPNIDLIHI